MWKKGNNDVTQLANSLYVVDNGTYDSTNNSQTTTLTVAASDNIEDTIYKCVISSDEWKDYDRETQVTLDVFCKLSRYTTYTSLADSDNTLYGFRLRAA